MKKLIAMFFNRHNYATKTLKHLLVLTNRKGIHYGVTVDDSLVCYSFNTKKELNEYVDRNLSKSDQEKIEIYAQLKD